MFLAKTQGRERGYVMRVVLGSDHAGFELKEKVKKTLASMQDIVVSDYGTDNAETPVDYPDIAREVAMAVVGGKAEKGLLFCGTGIGMSIAANKVPGAYAAHVCCEETARLSRAHNNSNILALGGRTTDHEKALEIVRIWLETPFEWGRHLNRFRKIQLCEEETERSLAGKDSTGRLVTFEHPLIKHKIGMVRDETTPVKVFRELVQEIFRGAAPCFAVERRAPVEFSEGEIQREGLQRLSRLGDHFGSHAVSRVKRDFICHVVLVCSFTMPAVQRL